jgi:hypothetical protein
MMYDGLSVRSVASSDRGSFEDGVRINRVLAASMGARNRDVTADDAVAIRTATIGEAAANMAESGMAPEALGINMSGSATPKVAARKLRINDSRVLDKIL